MCLILFAYRHHAGYPLILAANRDEFYDRPTREAHFWDEHPGLLAGRDLQYGGTWMGLTRSGRFAAVTNFRDRTEFRAHPQSRGLMVRDFLTGVETPQAFIKTIRPHEGEYNGFNLLLGDGRSLIYYSNRDRSGARILEPGLYGLSNALLDTPWPKVIRGKIAFDRALKGGGPPDPDRLLHILSDTTRADDEVLPDTGFGLQWEKILSSPFVVSPAYGTRASTVLLIDAGGKVDHTEITYSGPEDQGRYHHHGFSLETPW